MNKFRKIRRIIIKTSAIAEKNIQTQLRYKLPIIFSYISPIISMLMPVIVLGVFFELNAQFGPWTSYNYLIFVFIGYMIMLMRGMIQKFPGFLLEEKYMKTISALIIAPFNRFYLLFGYILSDIFLISIPFVIFFIISYVYYPISFFTFLIVVVFFFGVAIIFAGLSLVIGIFAISNENILSIFRFIFTFIFWASCVSYPYNIFPEPVQMFINLNPIYYIIDILRLIWIENDFILTIILHPIHIFVYFSSLMLLPIIGVYTFNLTYKKLGISGY